MTAEEEVTNWAARERAAFEANKQALFGALDAHGIAVVTVTFDGYGDDGQIEDIQVDGATHAVPDVTVAYLDPSAPEATPRSKPLKEMLEAMVYDCLAGTHEYWEDGEGAYGEVVFDAVARSIHLDFNERFVESTNFTHDF